MDISHNRSPVTPDEIRHLRAEMGKTQAQAAGLAGVNLSTWKRWESGKHQMPRRTFDHLAEVDVIESIACMAGVSQFIAEAIVGILPPVDAPIWKDEAEWRRSYGEYYDVGLRFDEDGWRSDPSRIIKHTMTLIVDNENLRESLPPKLARQLSVWPGLTPARIKAVRRAVNAIPAPSDPIWSDWSAWRANDLYAEIYDESVPTGGIYGCWPPRPRDVIAVGICYVQPADLKQTVNTIATARAERWVAAAPGREMPVLSGGEYDVWSIRRDDDLVVRGLSAILMGIPHWRDAFIRMERAS
ncbi:hypothetical protein AA12717_3747 [Gluconacetobacter sacchari DSM 12717]|uniref:Helix-turn-helix transcriptional regulator n=2 Tax=Gluconacetobacter sacchari TaxID=92759 RepID=A0A7W4NPA6_9PROT|nr:helix-turn-helix transcriptional regulator [Gluconacetobacter sacchari]MBB2158983.1 helix-turn-helix transcriptional regulator [Gluconacetobacter sacchari]GBQ31387.1 hypothetical protein AA12717_3747 [Gluconacetobacter sacchari DSM 12717]